jgi:DNA-binding transcriptional ArsR family regulator
MSSLDTTASLFAALGDATRLALVSRLARRGPASATALAAEAPVTRQAIHQHLEVLASAGLVRSERRGRERIWEVEPSGVGEVRAWVEEISAQWDDALERLREHVEGG